MLLNMIVVFFSTGEPYDVLQRDKKLYCIEMASSFQSRLSRMTTSAVCSMPFDHAII